MARSANGGYMVVGTVVGFVAGAAAGAYGGAYGGAFIYDFFSSPSNSSFSGS